MQNTNNGVNIKLISWTIAVFFVVIIVIANFPVVVVGAGERGVVFNNATGIEDRILGEGTHFRMPFVESVHTMSVRVQKSEFNESTASKDLQSITMTIAVNWQLNPDKVNKIYQQVGGTDTIVATILNNRVQQAVKANVSHYTAEQVQTNRDKLANEIENSLRNDLKGYDIILSNVSIVDLNYTAEFNQAIENKQLAQQDAEKASYLKQKAQNEAAAKVAEAEGDAKARVTNATAEAEAQKLLQQSLTAELLQKMLIERWDGHYPQYMLGGSIPLLQLPVK